MKRYTITDRISGTIVADRITEGDDDFPIYDIGDIFGLLEYSEEDVAGFLGTSDFELIVTRAEEIYDED